MPQEDRLIDEHFTYMQRLMKAGVVFLAGRTLTTNTSSFGIVIFQAESEEVARRLMHADPAMQGRVMRAELYPFRISLLGRLPEDE